MIKTASEFGVAKAKWAKHIRQEVSNWARPVDFSVLVVCGKSPLSGIIARWGGPWKTPRNAKIIPDKVGYMLLSHTVFLPFDKYRVGWDFCQDGLYQRGMTCLGLGLEDGG